MIVHTFCDVATVLPNTGYAVHLALLAGVHAEVHHVGQLLGLQRVSACDAPELTDELAEVLVYEAAPLRIGVAKA